MSTIDVANITDGTDTVATSYVLNGSAKAYAWVDMGTSPTGIKGQSLNSSSITDNGAGSFEVNLTSSMSSTFSVSNITSYRSSVPVVSGNSGLSMTAVNSVVVIMKNLSGNNYDNEFGMSLLGDLA